MTRFAALRALVAFLVVAAMALVGGLPTAQALTSTSKGASRFGACVAAQKSGDLLLLIDESGSLAQTDPDAARVQASRYLLQTLGKFADRVGADLDAAVAGIVDDYVLEQDWTRLTEGSAGGIADRMTAMASKNTGIDTDYWLGLDGARQALAARGAGVDGGQRCQAIAWFSDGKIDYTPRPLVKPYADPISLDAPNGVPDTIGRAVESICRPGGLADQIRSSGIITLGIGLGADKTPADFDVMSAISTGVGLQGMKCGDIVDPVPGDFYPVANIDDMLFAFDALNPAPGIERQGGVCQLTVCQEARHNFVLDRSIKNVDILGSGGAPGVVPYLISPTGETLALPKQDGKVDGTLSGISVTYEWQSESAQTISLQNSGAPAWAGQWAIVYVDTTGQHPDAVSRVSIHITTDIFPALANGDELAWHSGAKLDGVTFGLVDGKGAALVPGDLAGSASMSATLVPDGGQPIPVLDGVGKDAIATPVTVDLTDVSPGRATLQMSLVITTAPALDPQGAQIAPGTELSAQNVEVAVQLLPKVGLPTPGARIDFGSVQATLGANATLDVTGPGCVWISGDPTVVASPDGVGGTQVTSSSNSAENCLRIDEGKTAQLPVTLRTEHDGRGGLNGTVPVQVSALDDTNDAQVVEVPFTASLFKPLNTTNFVLVLIAALVLGPGIPLLLLYLSKFWASKIPDTPLVAERIAVEVDSDRVLRGGQPFGMADRDLVQPVPGLAGGARTLPVLGVTLETKLGASPFGLGHVVVEAGGLVSAGSALPAVDKSGLRAVLPLAVHNKWVLLHDPAGPQEVAEVLLLVAGNADVAARERIYEDVSRRLPELLSGLRLRAVQAGIAPAHAPSARMGAIFGDPTMAAPANYDPFGDTMTAPKQYPPGPPSAPPGPSGPPGVPPGPSGPPPRSGSPDPFDPFGEGA